MKQSKLILSILLLGAVTLTGCTSGSNNNQGTSNGLSKGNRSQPSENSGGNDHSFSAPSQNSGQSGRQPGENQSKDYAGGFGIKELENALRGTGAITTSGESYNVSGTNLKTAMRYGNIVIGTYQEELVDEALALYQKGSMTINGKEVKVVNMIGNFLLIVLDGEIDQKSIAAFSAVGGL